MEASKSVDDARPPVVVVVPSAAEEGRAATRRPRRRRRHLLRSSVYFVSVAALFGAACLVIAVRNAAQVTALKQRIERLERLEEGAAAASAAGDDASSESMYHLEAENLIWGPVEHRANMFRHRQRRQVVKDKKEPSKATKKPHVRPAGKANALSGIHLTLDLEEATKRLNQQKDVVTLDYGNLTTFGFRPKKENQTYIYKPWKVSDWSHRGKDYSFKPTEGKVKIERKGLYYIYSQILYHNSAARSSYVIMVDQVTFVKCMGSVDSISPDSSSADNARYKTCYVGAARVLEKGQHVWINDLYGHYVSPDPHANFFGLVKIVDLEK